jgi:protein TonB
MALAANGGRLKARVARLLDAPAESRRISLSALLGMALLSLLAASIATAQAQRPGPAYAAKPYLSEGKNPVMLRPIQETHNLPPYPKESIHAKEEGRVLLEVTIGTDGAVSRTRVFRPSGHPRLDAAANQFVKDHWRWQPALRAGKPVTATTRVSVLFKLKKPPV